MRLGTQLDMPRCPHCKVDHPSLNQHGNTHNTKSYDGASSRFWKTYSCKRCGGMVLAVSAEDAGIVDMMYPDIAIVDQSIPEPAKSYVQ